MAESNQGRTLDRALAILEHLSTLNSPAKLSHIAKETGLHVATAQRMLNHLIDRSYVNLTDAGYTLGAAVLPLAWAFTYQDRTSAAAFPLLTSITQSTGFTSSVFVQSGESRVLTARVEAPSPMRYQLVVGQRMGLSIGGGKVILAYMPEKARGDFLERYEGEYLSTGVRQTREKLESDLKTIKQQGYYLSSSERDLGTIGLTLPFWNSKGVFSGTVNVVTHDDSYSVDDILACRRQLAEAARMLSLQI